LYWMQRMPGSIRSAKSAGPHANGDGTFTVDGRTIDHRERMLSKIPPGV
jgi:hypothetical protein